MWAPDIPWSIRVDYQEFPVLSTNRQGINASTPSSSIVHLRRRRLQKLEQCLVEELHIQRKSSSQRCHQHFECTSQFWPTVTDWLHHSPKHMTYVQIRGTFASGHTGNSARTGIKLQVWTLWDSIKWKWNSRLCDQLEVTTMRSLC